MGRWVLAGAILLLVAVGQGDDIIFSAARLKGVRGAYKAIDSAHIYRVREDGSGMRQLTSSSESDTNPCLTVDGKEILFWRRNRNDLVGDIRLCSVALDGTRFKVIRNFEDVDLTRPIDAARLLTGNRKIHTSVGTDKWGEMRVLIAQPGGKGNFTQWSAVSPSGRYVWVASEDKDSPFLDLVSGRIWSLKGLPSEAGGVYVPEDFAWLDDQTLFTGYYEHQSKVEIFSLKSMRSEYFDVHRNVRGKAMPKEVFRSTQWATNPDGFNAFWYDSQHSSILFQIVNRSEDGGKPAIYCVRRSDGLIRFQIADTFLEDAKKDGSEFITTTWKWGSGFGADGTTPLRKLLIWEKRTLKPRQLGFDLAACDGAFFLPTGGTRS